MVDLVKIRRKAKEKAAALSQEANGGEETPESIEETERRQKPPRSSKPRKASPQSKPERTEKKSARGGGDDAPGAGDDSGGRPLAKTEPARSAPNDVREEKAPSAPAASKRGLPAATAGARLERFKRGAGQRVEEVRLLSVQQEEGGEDLRQLLSFDLAGEHYAVDLERIIEIITPRTPTRVPNSSDTVMGIISLRGTIVTILDLRRTLGHPVTSLDHPDVRIIVVEAKGETAGFPVDRVSRVIKIDPSQIEKHPVVNANEQSEYIDGVFQSGDRLSILLDLDRVLTF
ncbi:MAG: chemotaxis protein CheW [Thermoanaerobaculia bacterium]